MPGKNTVTLTFAGKHDELIESFDEVGAGAKSMADDVGKASREVASSGAGFDKASDAADDAEGKFQGMASTLEGTTDTAAGFAAIAKGDLYGGLIQVGQGGADLAEGLNYTVIPILKKTVLAIKNTTVAQKALNLAMRLNPIGLIITGLVLLVGGLILAYKKSETFRNIVQAAMRAVATAFGWIVKGFGAAWSAVSGAWNRFASWVGGWKTSITRRVGAIFSAIGSAFGNAWRAVGEAWGRFTRWVGGWPASVARWLGTALFPFPFLFAKAWTAVGGSWSRFVSWVSGWPASIARWLGSALFPFASLFGKAWTLLSGSWSRFTQWVGKWRSAFSFAGMFDGIIGAAKSAFNWLIGKWNGLSFSLPSVDTKIPGVGRIGGWSISTPDIGYFHQGGRVPGAPGSEMLAVLQAGEKVTPAGRDERIVLELRSDGSRLMDLLVELIRNAVASRGGDVQVVLGRAT